jgi:preprotein translocase subunit Sec63
MASSAFDPYEVLGVRPGATKDQIRAAYRELVARYHPDKHRGNPLEELAAAKLIDINRAYEVLSDDAKRAAYEGRGHSPRPAPSAASSGTVAAAPQPIMKLLNSVGVIVSLILFLRFGLGLARGILMGLLSLMRMGPVFAIVIALAIMMGGSYFMRARRK